MSVHAIIQSIKDHHKNQLENDGLVQNLQNPEYCKQTKQLTEELAQI